MVAVPYALWRRRAGSLWSLAGVIGFAALVGSWVAHVASRVPRYLEYVFLTETWSRLSGSGAAHADLGVSGPIDSLVPIAIGGALSWSIVVGWSWAARWRSRWSGERDPPRTGSNVFLALWLVLPTLVLGLAEPMRIQYALPVLPAFALALSAVVSERGFSPGAIRAGAAVWIVAGAVLLAAGSGLWEVLEEAPASVGALARVTAVVLGLLLVLAPSVASRLASRQPRIALFALALPGLLLPVVLYPVLVEVSDTRSSRGLARAISEACPEAPVVGIDVLPSSLPLYLGRPVGLASLTGKPFQSNFVDSRWDAMVERQDAAPLFTRTWWGELPNRVVVVFERGEMVKRTGAELQGFDPLAEDRVHEAFGRDCARPP